MDPIEKIQAAQRLLADIMLADATLAAIPETAKAQPRKDEVDRPKIRRLELISLLLDDVPADWLEEQIRSMDEFVAVGFLFSKPLEYSSAIERTPRLKEYARLLLKVKKLRAEETESAKGT